MTKKNPGAEEGDAKSERPRERIVACALELFHRFGIRGVGVEAIAEAAGTNKMTLYRHFASKDDLIFECLSYKGRKNDETWAELEAAHPGDPARQLYGLVGRVAKLIAEDERGCDFANAAVELTEDDHPALRVIEAVKRRQRERLERLCEAAGAQQPGLLADTIVLLIEGARVSRRSVGTAGPCANLARACEAAIASFGVPPRDGRGSRPDGAEARRLSHV
jgi:AcrR family transcriptional regulator